MNHKFAKRALSQFLGGLALTCIMFLVGFVLAGLNGYTQYKTQVNDRLIPFIW